MKEKIEKWETILTRQIEWIKAAETRLALVLPLSTLMLGALAAISPSFDKWAVFSAIVSAFATLLLVLALIFAALSMFPRTSGPKGSIIFFGEICDRDLSQFSKAIMDGTDQDYLNDLIAQCYRNAQIAERKFFWIQRSMTYLLVASLPWVISIFFLYSSK